MPGRIDGRDDYLALLKAWADQVEPYSDEQVKAACRRLMGKLSRFPYPVDLHKEIAAPTPASSDVVGTMTVELAVDTSQLDAALAKAEQLKAALDHLGKAGFVNACTCTSDELLQEIRDWRASEKSRLSDLRSGFGRFDLPHE